MKPSLSRLEPDVQKNGLLIDADGFGAGPLASIIAMRLRGKAQGLPSPPLVAATTSSSSTPRRCA